MHHPQIEELIERDPRYAYEAYVHVFESLAHTQRLLGKEPQDPDPDAEESEVPAGNHISGQELVMGICDLAQQEMGLMARTVFRMWGIERTVDFGHIVFNLIDAGLMSKTDRDRLEDFEDVCDMDEVLVHRYKITLDEDV